MEQKATAYKRLIRLPKVTTIHPIVEEKLKLHLIIGRFRSGEKSLDNMIFSHTERRRN